MQKWKVYNSRMWWNYIAISFDARETKMPWSHQKPTLACQREDKREPRNGRHSVVFYRKQWKHKMKQLKNLIDKFIFKNL
jgi:hypothetical protein